MGLWSWLNEREPTTDDFIEWSGSSTTHLQPLLVDGMLFYPQNTGDSSIVSLPAVYRGTQILTDVAGQLPWQAVRGGIHADQEKWAEPEILETQPTILVKPSPFHTRSEVIREIVSQLVWRGNAYLWLTGHDPATGRATVAVPINPDEVTCNFRPEDQRNLIKEYEWRGQKMTEGFDLLHIQLTGLMGMAKGLGPIDAARAHLGFSVDADKFGGEFFAGSATPAGVLQHPGRLDEAEALELRTAWENQHQGGRGTAVLSGGIEYAPVSITPEQAQFIATRAFNNQAVATLLGIPQHLLNAGQPQGTASSLTYANLAMIMEELYRMTLSPVYLTRIEEAFQRLLPRGQSVRFDTSELLRTDDAARWAAQKIALDAGILTNDEVRKMEGRAPIPESEMPDEQNDELPFGDVGDDGGPGVTVREDDPQGGAESTVPAGERESG